MNYFIQLDYKQFMKIYDETIAPWPLFPCTSITGANGNRISQQYLIPVLDLGHKQNMFRRTEFSVKEC